MSEAHYATIRAALDDKRKYIKFRYNSIVDADKQIAGIDAALVELDTLAAGQWMPTTLELYEYPDGKTCLVYSYPDGYGRAQLRYLQDADADTPKETIIILPEHLRLCQRAQANTKEMTNDTQSS
jgi:hypothetical protein